MTKPKLLDLYCGAGGASMGYVRAGFDVVGVDINAQPEYPFAFQQEDALEFVRKYGKDFSIIHASPPCQCFTKYRNRRPDIKERYEDLIIPTRVALQNSKRPYIIENVVGSPLVNPVVLCGSMFGLDVRRHRLFESNVELTQPKCDHSVWTSNRFPGGRSRERGHARVLCRGTVEIGRWNIPIATQQAAMGIDWINNLRMLSESIPPAYTEYLGYEVLRKLCL